jgi:hypothetical protein
MFRLFLNGLFSVAVLLQLAYVVHEAKRQVELPIPPTRGDTMSMRRLVAEAMAVIAFVMALASPAPERCLRRCRLGRA